jgi:hypothetical protein
MYFQLLGYFGINRDNIPVYDGINGIIPFRDYPVILSRYPVTPFYPVVQVRT